MNKEIAFIILMIAGYIIAITKKIINLSYFYKDLQDITGMIILKDYKVPGTKINIEIIGIHPTGVYIIKKIKYEGNMSGTEYMDDWEIGNKKIHKIKNPIHEIKTSELIISDIIKKPVNPIIIYKNKSNSYVFDKWNDDHIKILRENEQYKILKKTENILKNYEIEEIKNKLKQREV